MSSVIIPSTFVEADAAVRRIADLVTAQKVKGDRAVVAIDEVIADLNTISSPSPDGWLDAIQYINAQAAANPTDEAWQDLKRKKDLIQSDFQAIRTNFQAIAAAIDAV